jgi:hypothetical protein
MNKINYSSCSCAEVLENKGMSPDCEGAEL